MSKTTDLTVSQILSGLLDLFLENYPANASLVKFRSDKDTPETKIQNTIAFGNQTFQSLELDSKDHKQTVRKLIEGKCAISILDDNLYSNPDTTMTVIAKIIQHGGRTPFQPFLIGINDLITKVISREGLDDENMFTKSYYTLVDLFKTGKKKSKHVDIDTIPDHRLEKQWLESNSTQSNPQTHSFPTDSGLKEEFIDEKELNGFLILCLQVFGVFFYIPIGCYLVLKFISWKINSILFLAFLFYNYYPEYSQFPPYFSRHPGILMYIRYFSYKCIVESPSEDYYKKPSIYTFGPHGVFGIAPALQALINGYLVGEYFHVLGASAVFKFPLYNVLLRQLGFDDISYETFKSLLTRRHSVAIVPGGIGEMFYAGNKVQDEVMMVKKRKGFVKIALETGSQIIPTYSFGSTQMFYVGNSKLLQKLSRLLKTSLILFWGKWGLPLPLRIPMVVVVGCPIKCPKVESPSKELIDQYHEIYLAETQRIYMNYRNTYGWENRNLVFKS
jgi:hypothetical protein